MTEGASGTEDPMVWNDKAILFPSTNFKLLETQKVTENDKKTMGIYMMNLETKGISKLEIKNWGDKFILPHGMDIDYSAK